MAICEVRRQRSRRFVAPPLLFSSTMAKGKGDDDGLGRADSGAYTVFMDSNLDTHLAMIVSARDTVRDLKEKIMTEHPRCFPNIGEINVNALKVKRKGYFYHLSDSMLVKSAFDGFMKTWFLQFDASLQGHKQNSYHLEPGASDLPNLVFTMEGPLPETNALPLDCPSKDVSIFAVPSVPQVGSSQPRVVSPRNSSDDKQKPKNAASEGLSTRLIGDDHLIPQNSSDDKQNPKSAVLEGSYKDGPLPSSGIKMKKRKNKASIPNGQVDYTISSGKNAREETSEVALGNNHGDLEGVNDVSLAPAQTSAADSFVDLDMFEPGTSKVEGGNTSNHVKAYGERKSKRSKKHRTASVERLNLPVVAEAGKLTEDSTTLVNEKVRCDNNVGGNVRGETSELTLGSNHRNLGRGFDAALASGKTDGADPSVDMRKPRTSNVEGRDTSDHIEASKGRKSKVSKKNQTTSAKGLDLPMLAEPGNLTKDNRTLVYENVCCDNNGGNDVRGKTSEVGLGNHHGNLGEEFDAVLVPEQTDTADPFVGVDMNKPGTSKVERSNTSDHVEASGGRKLKRSKKHLADSVEGLKMPMVVEPGNLMKESTTLVHGNFRCDNSDGDEKENGKTEKEKKSLLPEENPKSLLSAAPNSKLESIGLNKTEMNSKSGVVSSNLLQSSDISQGGDSGIKRRKKSKKSKNSDQKGQTSSSGVEDPNGVRGVIPLKPELDKASFSDKCDDETMGIDNTLFRNEKAKVSNGKAVNTIVTGLDEADNACVNQVDLVPQIQVAKIQEAVEVSDCKVKRKSKKAETSAKNLPDSKGEKQDVVAEDPALSFDERKGKSFQPKSTKKTRLSKKGPTEQLADSMSEAEKDIGNRIICSKPCPIPGANEHSEVPLDFSPCNTERPPHEADIRDDKLSGGFTDQGNEHMEVPKFDSAKINYVGNFGPGQRPHEVAPGKQLNVKDIQIEMSNAELPPIKSTKKHIVHSLPTLPGLQKSLSSSENQGFKEKPQDDSFDGKVQLPISKTKKGKTMAKTHSRKTSTTGGDRVKDPYTFQENSDSVGLEASKIKIVDASGISSTVRSSVVGVPLKSGDKVFVEENTADSDASGSSSERPDVGVRNNIRGRELNSRSKRNSGAAIKASTKKIGEVINSSSPQKSLFAASGTIFKNITSDSSEDEDEINNSETSTKSPSDSSSSSSSDYLEGANRSPRNALYGGKRKETGGDNLIDSQSGGLRDINLNTILRSSSSYKKAKLTASQSQLKETESQPVDFVLDSLADP